jgi:hypothetical protein
MDRISMSLMQFKNQRSSLKVLGKNGSESQTKGSDERDWESLLLCALSFRSAAAIRSQFFRCGPLGPAWGYSVTDFSAASFASNR